MKYAPLIALWLLSGGPGLAQSDAEVLSPEQQQMQADELRAMEEQRAALLQELQQLREALVDSEARMAASQERVRKLQSQQDQKQLNR